MGFSFLPCIRTELPLGVLCEAELSADAESLEGGPGGSGSWQWGFTLLIVIIITNFLSWKFKSTHQELRE